MNRVLVDSSVWISYFKSKEAHNDLDDLIKHNQICTNNLILSELLPFLKLKNEAELIELLLNLPNVNISINWEVIINLQVQNLRNGINKVGIPDLIIVQNVIDNNLILYSEDKHFKLMNEHVNFDLFVENLQV